MTIHHRYIEIDGHQVFYREAGDPSAPHLLLLHGAPSSSHMFRELIPILAENHHVVAPDYLGFGNSDAPSITDFNYTFDAIAGVVSQLVDRLGLSTFAMYVQDYGAPVGWRLALDNPGRISAIISQNGNAYEKGFGDVFWDDVWEYTATPTPDNESPLREALTEASIRAQYVTGAHDASLVSPDSWQHDHANLLRANTVDIALTLFRDYVTNVALYPAVHQYFRDSQVPTLLTWGANDPIFVPAGATAFLDDLPDAEMHLLDGGHFLLETRLPEVSTLILDFLAAHLTGVNADG